MKPRILIVDDSDLNRDLLSCMLEDQYDILEAENGIQAIQILEKQCHELSANEYHVEMSENIHGLSGSRYSCGHAGS